MEVTQAAETAAKEQTATRERGIVKWFRNSYGFITRNDGTQVFAHEKAILMDGFRTLHDGQKVEYEVESSPKGPKAVRIKPLD